MITNILKNACEQNKLIDINIYDSEDSDSVIGYVMDVNDKFATIREIDKFGCPNGTTVYAVDDIKNISSDNWYLRSLQLIIDNHKKLNQNDRVTIHKKGQDIISYFKDLKENKIITMLFFDEDDYELGIVLDYDENFVLFKDIGQDGYEAGITCYRINDITGLRYNGLGEQKTGLLYKIFGKMRDKY